MDQRQGTAAGGLAVTDAPFATWRLWLVLLGCAIPIQMTVTASPFLNGVSMDARGLDSAQIGLVRTAEILTNASLQIWLSARIIRFEPRTLALIGVCLIGLGNLICTAGIGVWDLAAGRIICGAGAGSAAAALGAFIAQTQSPHRVVAGLAVPVTAAAILTSLGVGRAVEAFGQAGVFGILALGATVGFAFALSAPGGRPHARHAPKVNSMLGALRSPFVLACLTLYIGSTAVWHFFERIGISHGLEPRQIGDLSAAVGLGCAVLAPLAALVRDAAVRWGTLGALICFGIGSSTIPLSNSETVYAAGFALQSVAFAFWSIFAPAVASRLDRTGGLAAAGNGWNALGNALSPAIGGALILGGSFAPLGALCIVASMVTVTLMTIATRNLPPAKPLAPPL